MLHEMLIAWTHHRVERIHCRKILQNHMKSFLKFGEFKGKVLRVEKNIEKMTVM